MARAIDASRFGKIMEQWKKDCLECDDQHGADVILDVILQLDDMPTFTQPNETPPCYQPDGDGCAYQCYDGDDEPIDKCKECPLCYSDKQRHRTTLNEPLTCEGCIYEHNEHENCNYCKRAPYLGDYYYRRPPEGEEET